MSVFNLSWVKYPQTGLARSQGNGMVNFIRNCRFSKMLLPVSSPAEMKESSRCSLCSQIIDTISLGLVRMHRCLGPKSISRGGFNFHFPDECSGAPFYVLAGPPNIFFSEVCVWIFCSFTSFLLLWNRRRCYDIPGHVYFQILLSRMPPPRVWLSFSLFNIFFRGKFQIRSQGECKGLYALRSDPWTVFMFLRSLDYSCLSPSFSLVYVWRCTQARMCVYMYILTYKVIWLCTCRKT